MQETNENNEARPAGLRLTCDTMLGKLCRELRRLGVDTEYRRGIGGMRGYKQARAQGRVFLTRANRLKELPDAVFVESNDPVAQLVQVRERFGLPPAAEPEPAAEPGRGPEPAGSGPGSEPPAGATATRCRECNVALEKISRDQARPSIPFFIYQIHYDFSRCPKCRRVFWPGSHTRDQARPAGRREQPAGRNAPGGQRDGARPRGGRGRSNNQPGGGQPAPARRRSSQHGDNS